MNRDFLELYDSTGAIKQQAQSARLGMSVVLDFMTSGSQTTQDRAKNAAESITNAMNSMHFDHIATAKAIGSQHKTLQQTFTRLCLAWLCYNNTGIAESCSDGRNEHTIALAKQIYSMCQMSEDVNVLELPVPFI